MTGNLTELLQSGFQKILGRLSKQHNINLISKNLNFIFSDLTSDEEAVAAEGGAALKDVKAHIDVAVQAGLIGYQVKEIKLCSINIS